MFGPRLTHHNPKFISRTRGSKQMHSGSTGRQGRHLWFLIPDRSTAASRASGPGKLRKTASSPMSLRKHHSQHAGGVLETLNGYDGRFLTPPYLFSPGCVT